MAFVGAAGRRIEYVRMEGRAGRPTLVFLHEGLGSVAMWKDFPARVAEATGCETIVYSRAGYGQSDGIVGARSVTYMHDEALVDLPALLDALVVERPVLVGHSDGGSIALIHAAASGRPIRALVLMAPHVVVEDLSVASIAKAKVAYETTDLRSKLARYHADVDGAFWGWNRIWLDPAFRRWDITRYLPRLRCPVLAIQGEEDEYGTMAQVDQIAAAVPGAQLVKLPRCGHSPHRDQPQATIDAIARFVAALHVSRRLDD
jgi:pimeloyl-ACP methyl ester carboxylesterase